MPPIPPPNAHIWPVPTDATLFGFQDGTLTNMRALKRSSVISLTPVDTYATDVDEYGNAVGRLTYGVLAEAELGYGVMVGNFDFRQERIDFLEAQRAAWLG